MDPIADMITRIKNSSEAGGDFAVVPYSKIKMALATILKKEGFIKEVTKKGKKVNKNLEVELLYDENKRPKIKGINRISKLSRRVYSKSKDLRPIKNRLSKIIVSTSKGIMTGREAREANLGGEILFEIW